MRQLALATLLLGGCATVPIGEDRAANDLHKRILTLDAHLDTPVHFSRTGWNFAEAHTLEEDIAQVDLGRMENGNLDGGFFVIYTEQGPLTPAGFEAARQFALKRSGEIDRTLARYGDKIRLARTAKEVETIAAAGKLVALKSIENSYPLGADLGLLAEFYRRGVRLAGPVHSANNQFADSASEKPKWGGLSPLGRHWVTEMNRLGMVIDGSHSSDATFDEMLKLSKTPLLLSHSGSSNFFKHPRNIDDERIRRLAAAGGAICATTVFLSEMNMTKERAQLFEEFGRIGQLSPAEQADLTARWRALDQSEQMWSADFDRFMASLLHVIQVAGVDHVCLGADWDGGGGLAGIEDITASPKITEALTKAGYSASDIEKIWSGNILRIMRAAEAAASRP